MTEWINAAGTPESSISTLASSDQPPNAHANAVAGNGGGWESSSSGGTTSNPSVSHQARANDDESGGLMATVRSPAGSPIMARSPGPKDIIMFRGVGIPLDVAASIPEVPIHRNADGSFSDTTPQATLKDPTEGVRPATQETHEESEEQPEGVTFGEAGEAALSELMTTQQPGNLYRTLDSILQTGDVDAMTMERMSSTAGVEPGQMFEQINAVWQGAHEAGAEVLAEAGIEDDEAFQAFVTSDLKRKADFKEAARNMFLHGKPEGLRSMAENYLPAMDRYEGARVKEMLTEAGWQYAEKPDGGLNVLVSGVPVSWEVAVKQRIITFSRG
ncbi:hypothetical protein PSA7680_00297 [Pseudoruegeria aquimaris]|uniref:Uncharacterized protein n=1 Tax=Pseudoruegeria aquimaris TaxID=393663 RepID=A0A1Y5RCA4_9RHOB|nr:hypothetical protein [Pseudoruegeria aquimaris]SLN14160.1 hypothetical protein PSA7680_00297 [Pseudoruegeria aquimaris]